MKLLDLQAGQRVLDIGCGIGGGDFYMSETFDVSVVGIDLSVNMISIALERAIGRQCQVQFEIADCTTEEFQAGYFDVIYSRDTLLHIQVINTVSSFSMHLLFVCSQNEGKMVHGFSTLSHILFIK